MDPCFELTDRDGLARRGRIKTPHGIVHTPVLFPVLHPDPARQLVTVREIRERFHVEAVMTSSYILRRNEELAQRAIEKGIHSLLGFDGAVVTDSGAFQQHVYGEVEASPSEILEFQNAIGTDVATPLDLFVEPSSPREEAEAGVVETLRRVAEARKIRGDRILAVPVQGGLFADLRRKSAEGSEPLADILAVGGIVPLMDSYRFADLFRMLSEVRSSLAPEKPLHLFGLGHPMLFAFGALLGADIFDTASYHKFARRLSLQFPQGSMDLDEVREDFCGCALCDRNPLYRVREMPLAEKERAVALHNLSQCLLEMSRVRHAIRRGELWDLVEERATGHPALQAAFREILDHPGTFLATEPPSRRHFIVRSPLSLRLPAIERFRRKLEEYRRWPPSLAEIATLEVEVRRPSEPSPAREPEAGGPAPPAPTPIGEVPRELLELYPIGSMVTPEEFAAGTDRSSPANPAGTGATRGVTPLRHALGILRWAWGPESEQVFRSGKVTLRYSRSSGRLREILINERPAFVVGNEGIPHPTFYGGELLHSVLPAQVHRVVANEDAASFVEAGRTLFSQHVLSAAPGIVPFEYVLLTDPRGRLIAVGRALLASHEMGRFRCGVAVEITAHRKSSPAKSPD